jgi:hypothetical protein
VKFEDKREIWAIWLVAIVFWSVILYVAFHFIHKWW